MPLPRGCSIRTNAHARSNSTSRDIYLLYHNLSSLRNRKLTNFFVPTRQRPRSSTAAGPSQTPLNQETFRDQRYVAPGKHFPGLAAFQEQEVDLSRPVREVALPPGWLRACVFDGGCAAWRLLFVTHHRRAPREKQVRDEDSRTSASRRPRTDRSELLGNPPYLLQRSYS